METQKIKPENEPIVYAPNEISQADQDEQEREPYFAVDGVFYGWRSGWA